MAQTEESIDANHQGAAYGRPRSERGLTTEARSFRNMQSSSQPSAGAMSIDGDIHGMKGDTESSDHDNFYYRYEKWSLLIASRCSVLFGTHGT